MKRAKKSSFTNQNVVPPNDPTTMSDFTLPSNIPNQQFFNELKKSKPSGSIKSPSI